MGRRPNAVVAEFFDRGEKLDDASNRYQHTCTRCGQLFPKGRIENLVDHLLKNCPNVSPEDCKAIEASIPASKRKTTRTNRPRMPKPVGIPILERQQSALDTLAEVSRQYRDYSTRGTIEQTLINDTSLAQQALWAQLQQHNIYMPQEGSNFSDHFHQSVFSTADYTPSVVPTAMPSGQSLDPQLGHGSYSIPEAPDNAARRNSIDWTAELAKGLSDGMLQTGLNDPPAETVKDPQPKKGPKPRARFGEDRRKEVQVLRKQGACLRCRMLKKPCSEGTPCKTCSSVGSGKLWTTTCTRARLPEGLTVWSTGHFQSVAAAKTQRWSAGIVSEQNVFVKFDFSEDSVQLQARYGIKDNSLLAPALLGATGLEQTLHIENAGDLSDKIATYCTSDNVLRHAVSSEPHYFLRTTLLTSIDLLAKEDAQAEENAKTEKRSCYNIPNSLTKDTLELWVLTACLTAEQSTSFAPSFTIKDDAGMDIPDQELAQAQILAAVEVRAARLSKKVLNDLERRLLQRQQVSGFATYIAAVVLLSCAERMCCHFRDLNDNDLSQLWHQGPAFAALLAMLLRMRGLPPKTFEDEHGQLAVVYEPSDKLLKTNGSVTEEQLRAHDEARRSALTTWLAECKLTTVELQAWTAESTNWYGRLMAALLQ